MSGEFKFSESIPVGVFKDLVKANGFIIDEEADGNMGVPHFNVREQFGNNTVVWVLLNNEGTHVTDFLRYGSNDPAWLIQLMLDNYCIDIGEL